MQEYKLFPRVSNYCNLGSVLYTMIQAKNCSPSANSTSLVGNLNKFWMYVDDFTFGFFYCGLLIYAVKTDKFQVKIFVYSR